MHSEHRTRPPSRIFEDGVGNALARPRLIGPLVAAPLFAAIFRAKRASETQKLKRRFCTGHAAKRSETRTKRANRQQTLKRSAKRSRPQRTTTETGARRGGQLDPSTATPWALVGAIRLSAPCAFGSAFWRRRVGLSRGRTGPRRTPPFGPAIFLRLLFAIEACD